jgi:hypothetical protein
MRLVLCFAIWLATALVIGKVSGDLYRPREPRVDADYTAFMADKDAYDVLFLGSSRFYRGVIPDVFDKRLGKLGHPLRSYNLGMRGMLPHEVNELLRRVLAERPARLRWIVMELADWAPRRKNYFTHRAIAWHDLTETLSAIGTRWREDEPLLTRLDDVRIQLLQCAARACALGLAAEGVRERFDDWTHPDRPVAVDKDFERLLVTRGFAPFTSAEHRQGATANHRREFQASRDEFLRHAKRLPKLNAAQVPFESFNLPALQAQIEAVGHAGVSIVYVIPPSYEEVPVLHGLARVGHVPRLLAFDDPRSYPEFYQVNRRFDLRHLNQEGAERFSRVLAEGFAQQLDEGDH